MRLKLVLATVSLCALLFACEVEEEAAKELLPFRTISSNGMVKFRLIEGPENKVISTSIDEFQYNVSNGTLSVNAAGGSMTIAVRNLYQLWCNSCSVESDGLVADTLNFYVHAGKVELFNIHVNNYLGISALNTGSYKFSGFASFFNFATVNLATVEAYDLLTDSTYVNTTSVGYAEVHATQVLNVFINSVGGVYYKGNPQVVRATITGTGKLIKKD
ncbi:MAG TPA: DUF2807 domain-containing protein [Chryseosolibacter sp.]